MREMRKGFTLIELMIVVTIISILASIAIPNLLRARLAANETAAMASLRTIVEAQTIYRRTDWEGDGKFRYAIPFNKLAKVSAAKVPDLITKDIARASRFYNGPANYGFQVARTGYFINENFGYYYEDNVTYGPTYCYTTTGPFLGTQRYGIHAGPSSYNMDGLNSFFADDKGMIWQRDLGADPTTGVAYYWSYAYGDTIMKNNNWVIP